MAVEGYDLTLARPLLDISREELRAHLTARSLPWLEDPMNEDTTFDRVKIRQALAALAGAGLTTARIAAAAGHLARARTALEVMTGAVLARASRRLEGRRIPSSLGGGFALDPVALAAAPREVGLRALAALLMAVSGQPYRPRFEALERLFDRIAAGTLGAASPSMAVTLGLRPAARAILAPAPCCCCPKNREKRHFRPFLLRLAARGLLRQRPKTLNLLLSGNALETPYLYVRVGAGLAYGSPVNVP